jgi:hypothetical protein
VTTRASDPATEAEVYAHNEQLRSDPMFNPSYMQIADLDVTEILVSTDTIKATSHDQFFKPGARRAFVASNDACFGMARMFALHAEGLGQVIEVFRSRAAAEEWLGIS